MSVIRIINFRKSFLKKISPGWKSAVEKAFDETVEEMKILVGGDIGTKKCVICGKGAQIYTGHLHIAGKECDIDHAITAGFCSEKCANESKDNIDGCYGCVGYYQDMYGKKNLNG